MGVVCVPVQVSGRVLRHWVGEFPGGGAQQLLGAVEGRGTHLPVHQGGGASGRGGARVQIGLGWKGVTSEMGGAHKRGGEVGGARAGSANAMTETDRCPANILHLGKKQKQSSHVMM